MKKIIFGIEVVNVFSLFGNRMDNTSDVASSRNMSFQHLANFS